jgi:ketosteroid isomerase-like protein
VDALAAAQAWVDGWRSGWLAHEADPIAALYADDARFISAPFREPKTGPAGVREYAVWAFAEEDEVECRFGEPIVWGDRATVEYWAVIGYQGKEQTLAGVALLRFDPDGRVGEQRDYWQMEDGRRDPPEGWGR